MTEIEKLLGGLEVQNVVPFGKYRGQPMEVLRSDPGYVQWALDNGVISETKYRNVYIFLTGQQGENHDTPEHNRYQVMFLEPLFVGDVWDELLPGHREKSARLDRQIRLSSEVQEAEEVLRKVTWEVRSRAETVRKYAAYKYMDPELMTGVDKYNFQSTKNRPAHLVETARIEGELVEYRIKLAEAEKLVEAAKAQMTARMAEPVTEAMLPEVVVEFEARDRTDGGYDRFGKPLQYGGSADVQLTLERKIVRIDIKPTMGDDYPAVLRQMKAAECNVLYLVQYAGAGATLAQVKKLFALSGIMVMEHIE